MGLEALVSAFPWAPTPLCPWKILQQSLSKLCGNAGRKKGRNCLPELQRLH